MDKYTVDLDKVLNDFEYSELTDQYTSKAKCSESNYSTDLPGIPVASQKHDTTSSFKNSHVKHSINNVFQSLNDYLSTDIRAPSERNIENDKEKIKYPTESVNFAEEGVKNNADVPQTGTIDSTNSIVDVKEFVNNDLNIHNAVSKTDADNISNSVNIIDINDDLKSAKVNECNGVDFKQPTENLLDFGYENTKGDYFLNENVIGSNTTQNVLLDLGNQVVKEETAVGEADFSGNLKNDITEAKNMTDNSQLKENKMLQGADKLVDDKEVIENKAREEIVDSEVVKEQNEPKIEVQGDLEIQEQKDEETEVQKKIGFESVNVDESELQQYLEELEDEYESPEEVDNNEFNEEMSSKDSCNLDSDKPTASQKDEAAQGTIPNTVVKTEKYISGEANDIRNTEDHMEEEKKIESENVLQEPESSKIKSTETLNQDSNVSENINVPNVNDNKGNSKSNEKQAESSEPNFVDSGNKIEEQEIINEGKHNGSSDEFKNQGQKEREFAEVPVEKEKNKNADVKNLGTEESTQLVPSESKNSDKNGSENQPNKETPRRPSVLEVKSVIEEEPVKVSTIGKPGSTPYNNAYKYKPFNSNEDITTESDTESSSSSPSPTFSDMSTVSSATTATIDSCNNSIDQNMTASEKSKDNADDNEHMPKLTEKVQSQDEGGGGDEGSEECASEAPVASSEVGADSEDHKENDSSRMESESSGLTSSNLSHSEREADGLSSTQPVSSSTTINTSSTSNLVTEQTYQSYGPDSWLGKQAPLWIPDSETLNCLHCNMKFTIIKRRHHCRACGLVLCSKCCGLQYRLEYLNAEARVCNKCYEILTKDNSSSSGSEVSPTSGNSPNYQGSQPNPNNPMEYCSMVPPLQQISGSSQSPPTVMVPVGVLKRKGSGKARKNKSVMFCDGIRPGSELTNLDNDFNYSESKAASHKVLTSPAAPKLNKNVPEIDSIMKNFILSNGNDLPPSVTIFKSDISYKEQVNDESLTKLLKNETVTFALQRNLHVHVRLIDMQCCINKLAWCFSTEGLMTVGQDEIVILLEYIEDEKTVPKDVFIHLNNLYIDAKKGSSISELGVSLHPSIFLDSKNHAGFLYIRPTHQCLKNVIIPKEPYLIGILIHRWEVPWAKIFPLRLVLRLGAEYRYYPSPLISTRHRESVFVEIGHTIINLLADFRSFSYTLPNIRGLVIHMEGKTTTVSIPSNRYDQVMKSINNSSEHILAFGGNFSVKADSHLVCIQDTQGKNENTYATHTISIQDKPREVTGVSFIVFNGNLKSTTGLTAKSSVVEDGLMIHIPAEQMEKLRESLRNMKDYMILCGCINAPSDEAVKIIWAENDVNFNVEVYSPIDNESLSGVPSIRVHNGKDYVCNSGNRMIRWTEVFILQNGDENSKGQEIDYSKISESISKATCQALVKYLDLLSSNNFYKIGIRTNLHTENVSYSAGSNGIKLPPIYMKSLDNELIPVLHRITSNNWSETAVVLELIFRVLNV